MTKKSAGAGRCITDPSWDARRPAAPCPRTESTASHRAQAAADFRVNLKNEVGIEDLAREIRALRHETDARLLELERG